MMTELFAYFFAGIVLIIFIIDLMTGGGS